MEITKEIIEKIRVAILEENKTIKQIAQELNLTERQVRWQKEKNRWNIRKRVNLEEKLEEIKNLVEKNTSDKEIAKIYGVSYATIFKFRKKYNLERDNLRLSKKKDISKDILEILIGTILGDSTLQYRGVSTRFTCEHSIKQNQYIYSLEKKLSILEPKISFTRTNTKYPSISLKTKSTPSLNYLYDAFYKNGTKVIPFELFDNFTAQSLTYLFMDDGYPIGDKNKIRSIGISLCNFTNEELNKFIIFLKDKFDLNFHIQPHYNKYYDKYYSDIDLNSDDFNKFCNLIKPYLQNWAYYKIQRGGSKLRESENVQSPLDNSNPSIIEI